MTNFMQDQNRLFGLLMAGVFGIIAILHYIWIHVIQWWLIGLGFVFLIAGLIIPTCLGPVRQLWMKLGRGLAVVNTGILLTFVFAVMITPLAIFLRVFRRQPIETGISRYTSSYWHPRHSSEFTSKRMERQF